MDIRKNTVSQLIAFVAGLCIGLQSVAHNKTGGRAYYVISLGNDNNAGRIATPFKTIDKVNTLSIAQRF